jgi:2-C-methyl-D-erythritol 4-phosphate cytidylyltransferase/2-C-methyl-D-erythritol 2,4-cyclodiphosphate synthase
MRCIAVIVAAGRGQRFGGDRPKQYAALAGQPLLRHTLARFAAHPEVGGVLTVIHQDDRDLYEIAAEGLDLLPPVAGGANRQDSVRLGLESLADDPPDAVLIQDGARPMASDRLIGRVVDALATAPAVLPAVALADTLKQAKDGLVTRTLPRDRLFRAQTPQGFHYEAIRYAHNRFAGEEMTDDAALAEAAGLPVRIVPGEEANIKVTTAEDLARVERELQPRLFPRTGLGFDVHRLAPGKSLRLMGLDLPEPFAMLGHSDADVGLHAVTDALLGTIAAGDIGSHFPPSEARWKGEDSALFLEHARDLIRAAGGELLHVDATLICERPKIGPYREAMTARLAALLRLPTARVSVKATTTERLGFTGRGEGIAAQAIATVLLPA